MYQLTDKEQVLADKLTDAGLSQAEAEDWVRDVVMDAMDRGSL